MKKLLTILILLLAVASQGWAGTEILSNFGTVNGSQTTFSVNEGEGTFSQLAGAWEGGIQYYPANIWAYRLVVTTEDNADLKIEVEYDGGMSTEFSDAQATNQRILNLEHSKKITKIFIQDKTGGSQESPNVIVFTSINYDDEIDATAETGKTKLLDCFTPYSDVTYSNHKFSGAHDGGMQCWIDGSSNIHNSSIIVETSESKNLEIGIEYTDGWYAKYKAESKNFNLSIDPNRNIKKLEIYNRSGAAISELEFTNMLISNDEGSNSTIPKYSIKSGFTGTDENRTQTYTVPNETDLYAKDLYLKFNSSITAQILVTYTDSDNPVEYANKEAQERHLKLNFAKKLKEIKVISTSSIEWSWEDMYVGEEESNELESPTSLTLYWNGTKELSSETPLSVAASEFSSITAGTRVQFNTSANGTIKVTTTISSEEVTLQDGNVYGSCFFEVTEGNISSLKENGISITGTATLSEINITSTYSTGTVTLEGENPLPCGWSSSYASNTVTITGSWGARGWYVGDDKYNDKKCITVNFAESGVSAAGSLKMEYINANGKLVSTDVAIATSDTKVSLNIPESNLVRIVQVYITSETVNATYQLSSVEVEEKTNPLTLSWTGTQALFETPVTVAASEFSSVTAGTKVQLTVNADGTMKVAIPAATEVELFNGSVWSGTFYFEVTAGNIDALKANGISITGSGTSLTAIGTSTYATGTITLSGDNPLPCGWDSGYNTSNKTVTINSAWGARGWYVGDDKYNDKKCITVNFAESGVSAAGSLKMEYINANGKLVSTDVAIATSDTKVSLNIPESNLVRIVQVYITSGTANATYQLSSVEVEENASTNRTFTTSVTPTAGGTVTVKLGNEDGTVTTDTEFPQSTQLTAIATANEGYQFMEWQLPGGTTAATTAAQTVTLEDNIEFIAVFEAKATALAELESRTLYENLDGTELSWNNICEKGEAWGTILEKNEEIQVTVSAKNASTEWPKVILNDGSGTEITNTLMNDVSEYPYVVKFTLTTDFLTKMANGFKISGDGVTITKVALYKPAAVTPVFDENGKMDLSKFASDGTAGYSYADGKGTITTGEGQTYKGVLVNLGSDDYVSGTKMIFKFQSETSAQIHVNYVDEEWANGAQVSTTGSTITVPLDATKQVNRIDIQLVNANTTAVLTEVSISNKCTLTVSAANGTVAVKNGETTTTATEFDYGTSLTLTATANDGYVFNKWTKDGTALEDTSNPLAITMTADVTMAAIFKGTPLVNEERRTLWENASGQALDWSLMFDQTSAVGEIVETGEILIFTVKEVGANPKIWLMSNDGNTTLATLDPLIVGENRLSITADMKTAMEEGFKFKGGDATITKIELYKPTPITALAEEDTKTLWSNTSGTALTWNTIAIERAAEWGAVLEEDERIIISVKEKETGDNVWPTVQLQNDTEKIASTANLLNDMTVPCDITITLTAEMVSKMKNGFNITGDGATITKAVLYKPTMPAKTVHTLNSTETAISGDANVTVAAAKFANISAYDVLTVNFTITASPANVILKGNGEDGGWDYLKEMKFENGETLFALPLTPAMTSNLKKNGLQVTGSGYTFKSVTIKTAGEVPSDGEDDISNDASEEAKKVYNVLKDLYGKKIVSGVVANVDWNTKEAENVYGWTGKYPAMNVYDYINLHASKDVNSAGWVDYSDITTAKNWWKEGGIVGAMWHWQVKANNGTDYTCTPGTAAGETSFDASKVYVEGTSENTLAKQQLDQLCGYLKKMQDAGIPVVWRPLHEASGNVEQYSGGKAWFWWGAKGADVYKQLWQWMYNYMVKTKGLNNLIWVWTSQTKDNNWYPGDAYVDIIGRDNYGATAATLATEYEAQKAAYPNKMITLSECGNSESTEMAKLSSIWDAGSRWSWFMTWYDGDYNKGASTTHKHAGETWWKDAVSKDYVITRDKMKELLGQESSDDSKTGVNISLDDLNEGWSSSYNAATKTITTEGEWAARGWYIGDNRYNSKGSVTVKFEAVNFGVTLKMEYTNTGGESKSVSAGAAAGETGVELDIPADIKTMDKVYITYQPIGTLKLTAATVNDKVVDNRTERTLVEKSQAISDGDIAINRGLFSNAVAGDVLRIYADGLSESSKLALEPGDYSGAFDGANWTGFTESPFKLKLTATLIATIKEKGLLIRGESFTFKKAVLYTEKELGSEISDEEKKGDEEKDDEEKIIDKKTGEADLTVLSAQDDTKTTLTQNEDGSITMTTTEPYCAAQIWFNDPEPVAGNVLKVELAESNVNVTVTVKYTDGTESQMSANTMVANARAMTRAVASARAATRGDSDSGTTVEVPLETGKEVQNIEVKNNVAGTITIKKMQVTTINVFTDGEANLSMLKPQSNATYDTSTHTLATTKGWTGATISPVGGENVSGKELLIEFADASKVKVAVKYRTDVEGPSTIMEKAAKAVRLALDNTKNIQEISIQPTEASIVTFKKIAVNSEESDDGTLKPGKTITLWENAAGETLSWNEVAKQDASVGDMLQEYDELLITISGVTEGCDWPKVFIRDASSEQAGNEVLLNDVGSFPYTVRIVLTGEMAQQLQKGFSICGDGVTVTKLQVYRPEAPKTGDIHLADLNYGYNSSYDKGTHTITTTARWAARGWEIGDKRYNDKNLITVKFEPVDFPVTLKMEYTTGLQTAQATSVGVPAGRTELLLEIPNGISKLNRVYIIYENPGSVKLTEASVTYQDKLKLSTAIEAFEAEGVIRDGRYDTDGWYNLRGMRIAEPKTSGIYIHGGKKVVIY